MELQITHVYIGPPVGGCLFEGVLSFNNLLTHDLTAMSVSADEKALGTIHAEEQHVVDLSDSFSAHAESETQRLEDEKMSKEAEHSERGYTLEGGVTRSITGAAMTLKDEPVKGELKE